MKKHITSIPFHASATKQDLKPALRRLGFLALPLLMLLSASFDAFCQTVQTLNWNTNNNRSKYYNMCGQSSSSSSSLATCSSCSVTYRITETDQNNHNKNVGWMSFKAPEGCTITATLTSNGIEYDDWLSVSQGMTEDEYGNDHWDYLSYDGESFSSTTGGCPLF